MFHEKKIPASVRDGDLSWGSIQYLLLINLDLCQREEVSVSESCLITEGVAHDADVADDSNCHSRIFLKL